jgi:ATP-binding cassette subfamily B protein
MLSGLSPGDAPSVLALIWTSRLMCVVGCIVLAGFRWWLGLAIFILWPLLRGPALRVIKESVSALGGNADIMRRATYHERLATRPEAAKELRIFGLNSWVVSRFRTDWLAAMAHVWKIRSGMYRVIALSALVVLAVYTAAFLIVAHAASRGQISLIDVAVLLPVLAMTMIYGSITFADITIEWLGDSLTHFRDACRELEVFASADAGTGNASGLPAREVRFASVEFIYPGATQTVFKDLSLVLPVGRSTAIVGANGAGKTTLVKLLAGLHNPTSGAITADGIDIRELDPASWQRRVSVVFQDFVRYPLTAKENIVIGAVAPDDSSVLAAAQRAGAREMIESLPRSWDTVLSPHYESGVDLSGGQWQRVALARALYAIDAGASILVLDEPTAWMDVRAEAEFFDRFLAITRGLTTVVISHRFSTVRMTDNIFVIDDGRVVDAGSHRELIARDGLYARMYELQSSRFADADATVATTEHID